MLLTRGIVEDHVSSPLKNLLQSFLYKMFRSFIVIYLNLLPIDNVDENFATSLCVYLYL